MVREAEQHAADDLRRKEEVEVRKPGRHHGLHRRKDAA